MTETSCLVFHSDSGALHAWLPLQQIHLGGIKGAKMPKAGLGLAKEVFEMTIPADRVELDGTLTIPASAQGIVIFVHGSGSSRLSPRNAYVAQQLQARGLATLLFDLLTPQEAEDRGNVFNIGLLTDRLLCASRWIAKHETTCELRIGYFGASTGAAAALVAETRVQGRIDAIVSRGGRPDLAAEALDIVRAPTLLVVGGHDPEVQALNERAYGRLRCEKSLKIVPGAGHLFEEPGTMDEVVRLASEWFEFHLLDRDLAKGEE